jgi:hypothetical protein
MLRKSITAVVIAAFEMMITLDQWNGVSKIITAAVVFWWMNLLLLIGMEKEERKNQYVENYKRKSKAPEGERRIADGKHRAA